MTQRARIWTFGMRASFATAVVIALAFSDSGRAAPPDVPLHIKTWEFWDSYTDNEGLPASFVAAHAEFVEFGDNENTARHAAEYVAAGGKYAILYSDPHLVPQCRAPFTVPAGKCAGALGDTRPESAWLHAHDGSRLHGTWGPQGVVQDALDPGSEATQAAYRRYTQRRANGTVVNAFECDDTDAGYSLKYFHWRFHTDCERCGAREYDRLPNADAAWLSAQRALAASAARPLFFNGPSSNRVDDRVLFRSRNALGAIAESAFSTFAYRVNDTDGSIENRWAAQQNKILNVVAARRFIDVLDYQSNMDDPVGDRLYSLASIWLSYDPNYTIAQNQIPTSTKTAHGFSVTFVPEFAIVPTEPWTTARTDITTLRAVNGLYVREFRRCYNAGAPIGACAAIVNPSKENWRNLRAAGLRQHYTRMLRLDGASSYAGGLARFEVATPDRLAPVSGLILSQ